MAVVKVLMRVDMVVRVVILVVAVVRVVILQKVRNISSSNYVLRSFRIALWWLW